jgi:hypothetical protein
MRSSSVLLVGLRGLSAEIGKNLVLAGIGSLLLVDGSEVQLSDLSANFLLRVEDVDRNRAEASVAHLRELNPNVKVEALPQSCEAVLETNPALFSQFRAVILVGQSITSQVKVNELLRAHSAKAAVTLSAGHAATQSPAADGAAATTNGAAAAAQHHDAPVCPAFFAGECFGLSGFFVEDLHVHAYSEARKLRDSVTGKESDEEVVVAGVQAYARPVRQLYEAGSTGSQVEIAKKFGRKSQEKAACQLWMATRVLLQWRDEQQAVAAAKSSVPAPAAAVPALPPPSLSDHAAITSLLNVRDRYANRENFDPERTLPREYLLQLGRMLHVELAHVCAMVGGILGQEILKVLSGKDKPLVNTFVCDATVR